jgi:hypothetical protein
VIQLAVAPSAAQLSAETICAAWLSLSAASLYPGSYLLRLSHDVRQLLFRYACFRPGASNPDERPGPSFLSSRQSAPLAAPGVPVRIGGVDVTLVSSEAAVEGNRPC